MWPGLCVELLVERQFMSVASGLQSGDQFVVFQATSNNLRPQGDVPRPEFVDTN